MKELASTLSGTKLAKARLGALVAGCCVTLALAWGSSAALALEAGVPGGAERILESIAAADAPQALSAPGAATSDLPEQRNPYANQAQGYSLLLPGDEYGIVERDDGKGETIFYLQGSMAETETSYGSLYTVLFAPDWSDTSIVGEFFEQLQASVAAEAGEDFLPLNEGAYEMITLAGVEMPGAAWMRYDADSGYVRFELRALEVLPGGGTVIWSMSAIDDEVGVVLQALSEAVATFTADPAAYGGVSVVWADASSLATRPAGKFLPASAYGDSGSGGSASPAPAAPRAPESPRVPDAPHVPDAPSAPAPAGTSSHAPSYAAATKTDGHSYYFQVPAEWTGFTEFGGYGESSLLEAYDYFNPAVRMSFWGLQEIPGSDLAAQMAGVPLVMPSGSVASFVGLLPQLSYLAAQSGQLGMPDEVRILSVEILNVDRVSAVTDALAQVGMGGMVTDESIVLARMILDDGNNTEVIALIYGTVAATGLGDFLSYSVMSVYGIFAPADVFADVARAIAESGCGQFELHERYLQENPDASYDTVIYASSYQQWRDYILGNF